VGATLQLKLSAVIVTLVVALLALLAVVLTAHQVRALEHGLVEKAETYGLLVSREVASAVAFNDRQTAREVFEAAAVDRAVEGLRLYGSDGALLASWGKTEVDFANHPSPRALRVEHRRSLIRVTAPVVSIEGPRGALVLDIGTGAVAAGRRRAFALAVVCGLAAAICGLLAGWLIARSFVGRLAALARAAAAVASGDLSQPPVVDRSRDEIGRLTAAFNAMWAKLKDLLDHIQRSARNEAERLEALVLDRTSELNRRSDEMRLVLDNVEQGLVTVDRDGQVSAERSRVLDDWFGRPIAGQPFWDWICRGDDTRRDWLALGWDAVNDQALPLEVVLDQLPKQLELAGRTLELAYKPVGTGETVSRFLVMITDVTARKLRERAEVAQRELASVVERFYRDRSFVWQFFREARRLVAEVTAGDGADVGRGLHTLKGNAAVMGLVSLASLCNELEGVLAAEGGRLGAAARARLSARWHEEEGRFAPLLDADAARRLEVEAAELEALKHAAARGVPHAELGRMIDSCLSEPVERRLTQLAEQAERLAARLEKTPVRVSVNAGDLRLPAETLAEFWSACVHVIRNAVDHGLETAAERARLGKPETAEVRVSARLVGSDFEVEIADSGRGIDWEKLRASAAQRGIACGTSAELEQALFADEVTTRSVASEVSGRGYGMGAVRQACERSGGFVSVASERSRGTSVRFRWPASAVGAVAGIRPRRHAGDVAAA
jgi:two-component system chemotaxis sensor kinase CheA